MMKLKRLQNWSYLESSASFQFVVLNNISKYMECKSPEIYNHTGTQMIMKEFRDSCSIWNEPIPATVL